MAHEGQERQMGRQPGRQRQDVVTEPRQPKRQGGVHHGRRNQSELGIGQLALPGRIPRRPAMESGCRAIPRPARRTGARRHSAPSPLGHDLRAHRHRIDAGARELPWADKANIKTGADYLRAWVACAFRDPFEPMPYLFLWGNENSGKSILHEALELLVTKGVIKADKVLKSRNDFNRELAGAIICAVEETNVAERPARTTASRSTSPPARWPSARCGPTCYHVPNTTHWIQTANSQSHCPVFPGDTRITVVEVGDLCRSRKSPS